MCSKGRCSEQAAAHSCDKAASAGAGGFWAPYCVYVGMSAGYALLAAGIVTYWAPEASGSGMSQIKVGMVSGVPGILSRGVWGCRLAARKPALL